MLVDDDPKADRTRLGSNKDRHQRRVRRNLVEEEGGKTSAAT